MSSLYECHKVLTNGVGKCSRPCWDGYGMPNGFCDEPAYGPQEKGQTCSSLYVPALACYRHGGPKAPVPDDLESPEKQA